ncbi:MAG: hypothetical protein WC479_07070, partial [Candidatus Izemoplasmatales bacterium]
MTSGWVVLGDTLFIDTSYVNVSLQGLINDSVNRLSWTDTIAVIGTKYNIDTLTTSVYDSLSLHNDTLIS